MDSNDGSEVRGHEGEKFGEKNVRELQDHSPQGRGAGDLYESETQTASGLVFCSGNNVVL